MNSKKSLMYGGICGLLVVLFFSYILTQYNAPTSTTVGDTTVVREENGKQIIHITARGGYSPKKITAQSGKDTILEIETRGTYDCSTAFTIPSLGIRQQLKPTGTTLITIPAQDAGKTITGLCSMGMYYFDVDFK